MTHNWKLLGLQTLLAGALASSPVLGDPPNGLDKGKGGIEPEQLSAISKQLDEIQKSILANNKAVDKKLADLNTAGYNLELALQNSVKDIKDQAGQIKDLKDQIAKLQQDLDALKNKPTDQFVTRNYPLAPSGLGKVQMVNTYFEPQTILVNGRAIRVDPGETRTLELPAGIFTYEVLNVKGQQTRTLSANSLFTITVHPN